MNKVMMSRYSSLHLSMVMTWAIFMACVTPCTNRVALINRLLLRTQLDRHINATSFASPYFPYEARIPRIGWCSDDLGACSYTESQFIEVDFGDEVIVEAVAVLRVGGSCVKQFYVQYARSDGEFYCISENSSNSTIFNENGACYLKEKQINFTIPVIARFMRIIPIQWVGISICLTMELYGCTIEECPSFVTNGDRLLNRVQISLNDNQLFDITRYWCTNSTTPQNISLNFTELVHLTRLRVRGNSLSFRILVNENKTVYSDINGINEYSVSFNIPTIPLWPTVRTTYLEFQLYSRNDNPICFAVELSGCPYIDVIDHATEEPTNSSTLADHDAIEMCKFAPTSTCFIVSNTTCQTMVTTSTPFPSSLTTVQQTKVSDDDCNVAAIVVPIIVVVIASAVAVCIVILMAIRWKKTTRSEYNVSTSKKDEIICVVKNDLYQSQDVTNQESFTTINDSAIERPYSPTASVECYVQIHEEDSKATDTIHYHYPEESPVDVNPTTDYELVEVDIPTAEGNETRQALKIMPISASPSYVAQ